MGYQDTPNSARTTTIMCSYDPTSSDLLLHKSKSRNSGEHWCWPVDYKGHVSGAAKWKRSTGQGMGVGWGWHKTSMPSLVVLHRTPMCLLPQKLYKCPNLGNFMEVMLAWVTKSLVINVSLGAWWGWKLQLLDLSLVWMISSHPGAT